MLVQKKMVSVAVDVIKLSKFETLGNDEEPYYSIITLVV